MPDVTAFIIIVVVVSLIFDYVNGFHDSANAIATVVSTRVLTPRTAIVMAAVLNFIGARSSQKSLRRWPAGWSTSTTVRRELSWRR